jgi:hypothetical protein
MNKERKSLSRFVEEGDEAKIKEMEKYEGKERRFCKVRKGGDFFFFFLQKSMLLSFFFF